MNNFLSNLFKKLKSIKHIEIILAVLFGLIILMVYFSSTSSSSTNSQTNYEDESLSAVSAYTQEVEQKLTNLLSKIDGVGAVDVMIMIDEKTNLETEALPTITSAVVVAEGARNVWVKLEIVKAVEALLNLNTSNIEVLVGGGKS